MVTGKGNYNISICFVLNIPGNTIVLGTMQLKILLRIYEDD